ncbi:PAC2 family protein [Candidatus Woesearchaeota archaeon]|nr:PAC2 family protein [Candidatus Woesearchaeota archaeon]
MIDFNELEKIKYKNPIMIEGLPGIGNVGKIAVDFIIEILKPIKVFELISDKLPACIFVDNNNIGRLCCIEVYYKKIKGNEYFFVSGNAQPVNEEGVYELANFLLNILKDNNGKEIVTIGGIGLEQIEKDVKVYYIASNTKIVKKYNLNKLKRYCDSFAGPVLGVTGVLVGLSQRKQISCINLLVETGASMHYVGIHGAREVLKILNDKFNFGLNIKMLDKEINSLEKEITKKIEKVIELNQEIEQKKMREFMSYIG